VPIYEYECPKCGERFSRLRPMREMEEPAACPRCGEEQARRVLSVVAKPAGCAPSG
jgi:putative FmdB family regulatory protein